MLELTKYVLKKVSFDRQLFRKELNKAIRHLSRDELLALYAWCLVHFTSEYQDLIREAFVKALA
jgi:hypothetical protein